MADNTAALQKYLDSRVNIPKGTYEVDAGKSLRIPSNTNLDLTGVVLKALPTDRDRYAILLVSDGVTNVTIKNGELIGERKSHKGKTGEWGMGLRIGKADKVSVSGMVARDCWGDGFYIEGGSNVIMDKCIADNNRRQGLSIIAGKKLTVTNCIFKNTNGTLPSDGIDLEPNKDTVIDGVTIQKCQLLNNKGNGIEIAGKRGSVKNVNISGCTYKGNAKTKLKIENVDAVSSMWSIMSKIFGYEEIKFA